MIEACLKELKIHLPASSKPAANYVPFKKAGPFVYISGQLPLWEGALKYKGKIGVDYSLEDGQKAAELCLLNILATLKVACEGDLERVTQCIRLGGYVNCNDDFKDHSIVINGASDLMVKIFGEKGVHARAAVGVSSLPFNSAVEIEGLFEIKLP